MKDIDAKSILSGVAILVSLVTFVLSFTYTRRAERIAVRPILAFVYDGSVGWSIKNIGNGPALNVIVAQQAGSQWFNLVRIPPMKKDAEFVLNWLEHVNITALGSKYTDLNGNIYSSTCQDDLTRTFETNVFPQWSEKDNGKHWNQPVYNPKSHLNGGNVTTW